MMLNRTQLKLNLNEKIPKVGLGPPNSRSTASTPTTADLWGLYDTEVVRLRVYLNLRAAGITWWVVH